LCRASLQYSKLYKIKKNYTQIVASLEKFYDSVDRIELYVGGALERRNGSTGELFSAIIKEQLSRTRDSDKFWFENPDNK